uniref:Zgc:92140 n=1 Tax=Cyprinus carpio carpio TaxID=630221 RepID=A0A9J7WWB2_CYPCA
MGCTSAKQVSAVPNDEEGRGKAYSNGDLFTDEYKMKGVEEVKYMRGEEDRVNARNQENLEKNSMQHRTKQHKECICCLPSPTPTNFLSFSLSPSLSIHTSESQQEFFRMLDEKIEKGRDYCSEEEDDVT